MKEQLFSFLENFLDGLKTLLDEFGDEFCIKKK